jgi:hypothetical protein
LAQRLPFYKKGTQSSLAGELLRQAVGISEWILEDGILIYKDVNVYIRIVEINRVPVSGLFPLRTVREGNPYVGPEFGVRRGGSLPKILCFL